MNGFFFICTDSPLNDSCSEYKLNLFSQPGKQMNTNKRKAANESNNNHKFIDKTFFSASAAAATAFAVYLMSDNKWDENIFCHNDVTMWSKDFQPPFIAAKHSFDDTVAIDYIFSSQISLVYRFCVYVIRKQCALLRQS